MNKSIFEYIYNDGVVYNKDGTPEIVQKKNRVPIGVVAATTTEAVPDTVFIGWSKAHVNAGDTFDKKRGVEIAMGRSAKFSGDPLPDSHRFRYFYCDFAVRAKRYFKDKKVLVAGIGEIDVVDLGQEI